MTSEDDKVWRTWRDPGVGGHAVLFLYWI